MNSELEANASVVQETHISKFQCDSTYLLIYLLCNRLQAQGNGSNNQLKIFIQNALITVRCEDLVTDLEKLKLLNWQF